MQIPGLTIVAVLPETVQTAVVAEEITTGRPELAVADKAAISPVARLAMAGNVMVCGARDTGKLCSVIGAGA
jgi:hypothetical protein